MNNFNDDYVSVDLSEIEENDLECYIIIKGEKIPCTREVYLAYKRPGRKEAMRQYRNKQRPFVNGHRCQSDCKTCVHFMEGVGCTYSAEESLDYLQESTNAEPAAPHNMEDEVMADILIKEMYAELQSETDCCRKVFTLMIKETPQREIATELGISDGTVTYYVKKIRKRLANFR